MNTISFESSLDLLKGGTFPAVNQISGFCSLTELLDPDELIAAYNRVRESSPHRHERNKRYFVGHTRVTSSGGVEYILSAKEADLSLNTDTSKAGNS